MLSPKGVSVSTAVIENCNKVVLKEIRVTMEIGQLLGHDFKGNEEEVFQKLLDLELQDQQGLQRNVDGAPVQD